MNYAIILAISLGMVGIGVIGYLVGFYHRQLLDKILALTNRPVVEAPPEPEKPTVTGGAYKPPREISNTTEHKKGAGLVETKTPEQLDWEYQNELHNLETS